MPKFKVKVQCYAEIEVDQSVIDSVTDEWRSNFYRDVETPQDVAEHIAFNMIVHGCQLSGIDGFADKPDSSAKLVVHEWDVEEIRT